MYKNGGLEGASQPPVTVIRDDSILLDWSADVECSYLGWGVGESSPIVSLYQLANNVNSKWGY
ncbi:hypothetical protein Dda_2981 [Drechslerella dactyloides]|uniref:Uncharacterized protein n=1 Tax=Drechslerella dactyloides TaxID=74499 RepID=A0AAD6J121_DREDA|nr:hypothetical protein Dda_2981 [Drechslerella dactyloides]